MTRGGKRHGAGRPSKAGTPRSFRLSTRACQLLDGFSWRWARGQGEVVEMALDALLREHPIAELAKAKKEK